MSCPPQYESQLSEHHHRRDTGETQADGGEALTARLHATGMQVAALARCHQTPFGLLQRH